MIFPHLLPYLPHSLLGLGLLIGLYYLLAHLRNLRRMLKVTIQRPLYAIKPEADVPDHFHSLFQKSIRVLHSYGFQLCAYTQNQPLFSINFAEGEGLLLYNSTYKTYAQIRIRCQVESHHLFDVEFLNFLQDDTLLLTLNGKAVWFVHELPNAVVQDLYTPQTRQQWIAHRNTLQQLTKTNPALELSAAECLQKLQDHYHRYVDSLLRSRKIAQITNSQQFHFRWQAAWRQANPFGQRYFKGLLLNQLRKQSVQIDPTLRVEVPIALEIEGFRTTQQLEQTWFWSRQLGIWLLPTYLWLMVISFGVQFGWPLVEQTVGVLWCAILLRELGRFLAMRWFGYQLGSIGLIPLLGAMALGKKDNATFVEKGWILLAGPLLGLLLGIGLMGLASSGLVTSTQLSITAGLLIIFNLFYLLPIYPLDGGKVIHLVLLAKFPNAAFLLRLITVILLGLAGLLYARFWLIASVLIALDLPAEWQMARVEHEFRRSLPIDSATNQHDVLTSIYTAIRQSGYGDRPFLERYRLANKLLDRYQDNQARRGAKLALVGLYMLGGLSLALGSLIAAGGLLTLNTLDTQGSYKREIKQADRRLAKNPNDVDAYLNRAEAKNNLGDHTSAIADLDQAIKLNPHDHQAYKFRSQLRYQMGDREGANQDAQRARQIQRERIIKQANQQLQRANQQLEKDSTNLEAYLLRARAKESLGNTESAIADLDQVIRLNANSVEAYRQRGNIRLKLGDRQGAQQDLSKAHQLSSQMDLQEAEQRLQTNPHDALTLAKRARAKSELDDLKGALKDYDRAIALQPSESWLYVQRGHLYYELKDYQQAIADANRAIKLDPDKEAAYRLRGDAREQIGDQQGAAADRQKAFDHSPSWD